MRSPNALPAAHCASECTGCQSPVCAANATTSDSVIVRPRDVKLAPSTRRSNGADQTTSCIGTSQGGECGGQALAGLRRGDDLVDEAARARRAGGQVLLGVLARQPVAQQLGLVGGGDLAAVDDPHG